MATQQQEHVTQHVTPFKYSNRVLLKTLLAEKGGRGVGFVGQRVVVGGWVKSAKEVKTPLYEAPHRKKQLQYEAPPPRPQPSTVYLDVTDGSCVDSLQVVVDSSVAQSSNLLHIGICILVEGQLEKRSTDGKHVIELKADKVLHIGTVDFDKYPLSKKRVQLELLRDYPQFRPRTTTVKSISL